MSNYVGGKRLSALRRCQIDEPWHVGVRRSGVLGSIVGVQVVACREVVRVGAVVGWAQRIHGFPGINSRSGFRHEGPIRVGLGTQTTELKSRCADFKWFKTLDNNCRGGGGLGKGDNVREGRQWVASRERHHAAGHVDFVHPQFHQLG